MLARPLHPATADRGQVDCNGKRTCATCLQRAVRAAQAAFSCRPGLVPSRSAEKAKCHGSRVSGSCWPRGVGFSPRVGRQASCPLRVGRGLRPMAARGGGQAHA